MSYELAKLKGSHRFVMALMARGMELPDICEKYKLNYQSWKVMAKSTLFQTELKAMIDKHVEGQLEEASDVMLELHAASLRAAQGLVEEMDCHDFEGSRATAATRNQARLAILDRCGYNPMDQSPQAVAAQINLTITAGKLDFILKRQDSQATGPVEQSPPALPAPLPA